MKPAAFASAQMPNPQKPQGLQAIAPAHGEGEMKGGAGHRAKRGLDAVGRDSRIFLKASLAVRPKLALHGVREIFAVPASL